MSELNWRKSSYSGNGGNCVEVAVAECECPHTGNGRGQVPSCPVHGDEAMERIWGTGRA